MITLSIQDKEGILPEDPAIAVTTAAAACVGVDLKAKGALSTDEDKAFDQFLEDGEMVDLRWGRLVCIITSTAKFL